MEATSSLSLRLKDSISRHLPLFYLTVSIDGRPQCYGKMKVYIKLHSWHNGGGGRQSLYVQDLNQQTQYHVIWGGCISIILSMASHGSLKTAADWKLLLFPAQTSCRPVGNPDFCHCICVQSLLKTVFLGKLQSTEYIQFIKVNWVWMFLCLYPNISERVEVHCAQIRLWSKTDMFVKYDF